MRCKDITRRSFLRVVICLSGLSFTRPIGVLAKLGESRASDFLAMKLAMFFVHKGSAAVIGREYLRNVPQEADERILVDLVCLFHGDRRSDFAKAKMYKLRKLLEHQQREEFESGRIVNVRGWILSETEARLCALAALI
jgi:hypothetical protein